MSNNIPFTEVVAELPATTPFAGPEAIERETGRAFSARLGANESAFGLSPKALQAMQAAVETVNRYGDPENHDLRAALAEVHGVTMDEICIACGIDELLGFVIKMTVQPGTPVVTSLGAYPTFNYHVAGVGGRLEAVPYRDDHEDPEALLDKAAEVAAPLMFFANPDNPMGTWHPAERVQQVIDRVPDGRLLILDEAYVEFAPEPTGPPIDTSNPRVIRMRTFSKAHGMAGARIGYAIGHKRLIQGLNKIRLHFGVNRLAQIGALASLQDTGHIARVVGAVAEGRQAYCDLATRLGLAAVPSATNFVSIDVGQGNVAAGDRARALVRNLADRGVFVRMPGVPPLDRCIRVSVGTPEERRIFARVFERALATLAD